MIELCLLLKGDIHLATNTVVITRAYSTSKRIWIILGVILLVLGSLIVGHSYSYRERLLNDAYRTAAVELSASAASLSTAIESRLLLANGLNAYVTTAINQSHGINQTSFEAFASRFIHKSNGVRNLSVYPDGIAKYVYPLENNEELIGLNLLTHSNPDVRLNAERTMLIPDMTFLGPFELTQGGLGS